MKNLILKTSKITIVLAATLAVFSCKKKNESPPAAATYGSMGAFYTANAVQSQFFNVDAAKGGSFTTPKGTKVSIPPMAFVDNMGNPILSGNVSIQFKDIYKKSDMLLSKIPTMLISKAALVSGGEFYIAAAQNQSPVDLAKGKGIQVAQPASGNLDSAMQPFLATQDTVQQGQQTYPDYVWTPPPGYDTIEYFGQNYIFKFYSFNNELGRGTWCNTDNATYFSGYSMTNMNVDPTFNLSNYSYDVFMVFKGLNCVIDMDVANANVLGYPYAPIGLPCTLVALASDGKQLYASFTDVTISANQNISLSISPISSSDFIAKLRTLDN